MSTTLLDPLGITGPITDEPEADPEIVAISEAFADQFGFTAGFTGDDNFGVFAIHENGETLVAITESSSSGVERVTGAVWTSPDGDSIVVHNGPDGLPERAIMGETVFLFSNFGIDTVDIAIVSPDGSVDVARNTPVDPKMIADMQSQNASLGTSYVEVAYRLRIQSLSDVLKVTSATVGIAGCAVSLGLTPLSAGAAAPVAGLVCASALTSSINAALILFTDEDSIANDYFTFVSPYASAFACLFSWTRLDCIPAVLEGSALAIDTAEYIQESNQESISDAEIALVGDYSSVISLGSGDVQVNLRWHTIDDLDLHVIDPAGYEIYFAIPDSPTGGELDIDANADCLDNLTSSPVENIFWPRGGAPSGEYSVFVHFYADCSSQGTIPFDLLLLVDGNVTSFSGSVSSVNEVVTVTGFSR